MIVSFTRIENGKADIELTDLFKDDGTLWKSPSLSIYGEYWDSDEYLKALFEALKDRDRDAPHYQDLKDFCKDKEQDFKQTKKELKTIYKESKKLGFWK